MSLLNNEPEVDEKRRKIMELEAAILLTRSMISKWHVDITHYQKKLLQWQEELDKLTKEVTDEQG